MRRSGPRATRPLRRWLAANSFRAFVALGTCCVLPNCLTSTVRFERPSHSPKSAGSPATAATASRETDDFGVLLSDEAENRNSVPADTTRLHRLIDGWLGTRYHYGGMSRSGVDCSGLVCLVFRAYADMALPRSSRDMLKIGNHVPLREARLGDLFLFRNKLRFADHVGICIGNGRFVHASRKLGVIESDMDDEYYRSRFIEARRLLP